MSGAIVPPNTTASAMISRMLLNSRKISREPNSKPACDFSNGARHAYSASAPPMMMTRNARMKMPRAGSAAKECTDTTHARAHEERAEQAQREREDREQQRPALEEPALVRDRERMDERRAGEPRHEGRVLDRIPEPVAAPAELVVRPPAAERDAHGEEGPGRRGPRARPARPRLVELAFEHRRARRKRTRRRIRRSPCRASADGWRAPGPAAADSGRGRPAPPGSSRRNGFEVASVNSRKAKLTKPSTPSTRAAKRCGRRETPMATATVQHAEQEDPQQQRAFVRAPHRRDRDRPWAARSWSSRAT